ncbi:MAG: cell envelope integrity protein CreD [Maricaulaceae bacterium]
MNTPQFPSPMKNRAGGRSLGLKLLMICVLVIAMGIPALFISYVSFERAGRAQDVVSEVSKRYGGEQSIMGPVIVVPYRTLNSAGYIKTTGEYVIFAENGNVTIEDLKTETKRRSLYKVTTYKTAANFTAEFDIHKSGAQFPAQDIDWAAAKVMVGISNVQGLRDDVFLKTGNGKPRKFEPAYNGLQFSPEFKPNKFTTHYRAEMSLSPRMGLQFMQVSIGDLIEAGGPITFTTQLPINGAGQLSIVPFAKTSKASLSSDWPHPGFIGTFPPTEREITDAGFTASWSVPFLARGIPGAGTVQDLMNSGLGHKKISVSLVQLVDPYQTVNRALKYAVMFIGLVFLTYFLLEVLLGVRVHAAQYVLIGLAQSIFYLLLLAMTEHFGFTLSFALSAGATIIATAGYAGAVFGGRKYALQAGAIFAGVYGLLFVLMRIEDFALLVGALASFVAIAGTMYLTRNVNWYGGSAAVKGE